MNSQNQIPNDGGMDRRVEQKSRKPLMIGGAVFLRVLRSRFSQTLAEDDTS